MRAYHEALAVWGWSTADHKWDSRPRLCAAGGVVPTEDGWATWAFRARFLAALGMTHDRCGLLVDGTKGPERRSWPAAVWCGLRPVVYPDQ
jgi:hypothetical protein